MYISGSATLHVSIDIARRHVQVALLMVVIIEGREDGEVNTRIF